MLLRARKAEFYAAHSQAEKEKWTKFSVFKEILSSFKKLQKRYQPDKSEQTVDARQLQDDVQRLI